MHGWHRTVFSALMALALSLTGVCARAESDMDVLLLRHRTVEQVLPVLESMAGRDAVVTGINGRLFVRGDAQARARVRQVLEQIDTPARQLLITVTQDNRRVSDAARAEVSGSVGGVEVQSSRSRASGGLSVETRRGDDHVGARIYSSRGSLDDRLTQQVRVMDGGRALIRVGQSVPIAFTRVVVGAGGVLTESGTEYRDLASGFYVRPSVTGSRVQLEITPGNERLSAAQTGVIESSGLSTTVTVRPGEWVQLGGTSRDGRRDDATALSRSTHSANGAQAVWLRVEVLGE